MGLWNFIKAAAQKMSDTASANAMIRYRAMARQGAHINPQKARELLDKAEIIAMRRFDVEVKRIYDEAGKRISHEANKRGLTGDERHDFFEAESRKVKLKIKSLALKLVNEAKYLKRSILDEYDLSDDAQQLKRSIWSRYGFSDDSDDSDDD